MVEPIQVGVFRGVPIMYDAAAKQFTARVPDSRDRDTIRKSSQRDVERALLKLLDPSQHIKALKIEGCFHSPTVEAVTVVGEKRGKFQFKDDSGSTRTTGYSEHLYLDSPEFIKEAKDLVREHKDWEKRWSKLLTSGKRVKKETEE